MAENTNPSRIKEVLILGEDGTPVGDKVKISPDAADVMVHDATGSSVNHASLQDFLFRKFPTRDTEAGQMRVNDEEDLYFTVDPTRQSVWQGWYDYQDMTKKRLAGLYKITQEDGDIKVEYVGDFLLGQETDLQAELTLEDNLTETEIDDNIERVIELYQLANKKDKEDKDILDYKVNSDGDDETRYTPEDKAKELMFSFGDKSFWQAIIDRELENKNKLIGIYNKDGECVGHFEATRYNLEALKEVYSNGITVEIHDGIDADGNEIDGQFTYGIIETDKDAMDLIVDTSKKSVYQQLIDLKDFWITLPFEVYNKVNEAGFNIANKNDIQNLRFNPTTE